VVAGAFNFIHFFIQLEPILSQGAPNARRQDYHITIDGNLTEGPQFLRFAASSLGYSQSNLPYGDPGEEEDGVDVFIDLPVKGTFDNPYAFKYQSSTSMNVSGIDPDNIAINVIMFQGFSGFGGTTLYPHVSMFRTDDDQIHAIWPGFQGGGPFSLVHKTKGKDLGPAFDWNPPSVEGFTQQAGPLFVDLSLGAAPDKLSARLYTLNGVDYIASFTGTLLTAAQSAALIAGGEIVAGGPNNGQFANIFQWVQIPELPFDPSFDMDAAVSVIVSEF